MGFVYLTEVRFSVLNISVEQQTFSFLQNGGCSHSACLCLWLESAGAGLQDSWAAITGKLHPSPSAGNRLQELFTVMVNTCNF